MTHCAATDRCDLRCVYAMSEHMTFLPKREVLSIEVLGRLCTAFIRLDTNKIGITGGESLVRSEAIHLFESLGQRVASGQLCELTLTTNGTATGPLRGTGDALLERAIKQAIAHKPKGHDFRIARGEANISVNNHISVTGG